MARAPYVTTVDTTRSRQRGRGVRQVRRAGHPSRPPAPARRRAAATSAVAFTRPPAPGRRRRTPPRRSIGGLPSAAAIEATTRPVTSTSLWAPGDRVHGHERAGQPQPRGAPALTPHSRASRRPYQVSEQRHRRGRAAGAGRPRPRSGRRTRPRRRADNSEKSGPYGLAASRQTAGTESSHGHGRSAARSVRIQRRRTATAPWQAYA